MNSLCWLHNHYALVGNRNYCQVVVLSWIDVINSGTYVAGIDLVNWMMRNLDVEEQSKCQQNRVK